MQRFGFFMAAALALFFCKTAPLLAESPAARVKAFVDGTKTFRARFTQSVIGKKSGKKPQVSSGVVTLSRPGKFRWQIEQPYEQLMLSDGHKVWLYDPELKQVTVQRANQTLTGTPAALLAGDSAIDKNFTLNEAGSREGRDWIEALPKNQEASFSRILLGFKGDALQVMELSDNFGQTTHILFSTLERNPVLPPSTFNFTVPSGVDVVGE